MNTQNRKVFLCVLRVVGVSLARRNGVRYESLFAGVEDVEAVVVDSFDVASDFDVSDFGVSDFDSDLAASAFAESFRA